MICEQRCRGFSLLELMIVLVIMAAATAVVWPNLQKPLRRTSLTESASMVRELLDDGRNLAASRGSAYFVRLEVGSGQLYVGTLQKFIESSSISNDSAVSLNPGRSIASLSLTASNGSANLVSPQRRQLPETVVVSDVRKSIARANGSSQVSAMAGNSVDNSSYAAETEILAAGQSRQPLSNSPSSGAGLDAGLDSQVYWLPLLASDLGRDATITLYDTQLQDSIEIAYCAATGAIEILP